MDHHPLPSQPTIRKLDWKQTNQDYTLPQVWRCFWIFFLEPVHSGAKRSHEPAGAATSTLGKYPSLWLGSLQKGLNASKLPRQMVPCSQLWAWWPGHGPSAPPLLSVPRQMVPSHPVTPGPAARRKSAESCSGLRPDAGPSPQEQAKHRLEPVAETQAKKNFIFLQII